MDQSLVPFYFASNTTLDIEGKKIIAIRGFRNGNANCTVSLTLCVDRTKLKTLVIFKGEKHGPIATDKLLFSKHRDNLFLTAQSKG